MDGSPNTSEGGVTPPVAAPPPAAPSGQRDVSGGELLAYARRSQYAVTVTLAMLWTGLVVFAASGAVTAVRSWVTGKIQ